MRLPFPHLLYMLCVCIMSGCSATKSSTSTAPVSRNTPHFDYTPSSRDQAGSAGITIALVAPHYIGEDLAFKKPPFDLMVKNMSNDFEELLTAKGFTIRGPFKSRDEMVFNDKENSDFIMTIDIGFRFQMDRKVMAHKKNNWGSILSSNGGDPYTYTYSYSGAGNIVGELNLTILSSSHGEKLWKKNITMDPIAFDYQGSLIWNTSAAQLGDEFDQDPKVYNILIAALEKYYESAFDLASRQIDVNEMKDIAKEGAKAEKKNQ